MHIDLDYFNAISNNVTDVSDSLIYDFDFEKCNFEKTPLFYLLNDSFFKYVDFICDYDSANLYAVVFKDKKIATDLNLYALLNLRVVYVKAGILYVENGGNYNVG